MSEFVFEEYNTVLGRVDAIRVTDKNIRSVARYCDGDVHEYPDLDAPEPVSYITLIVLDRHLRSMEDKADIGEWVVVEKHNGGHFGVYADKLFLGMVRDMVAEDAKHDSLARILTQLMEYQDFVTSKGGTTEETASAAELAALQIAHLFR